MVPPLFLNLLPLLGFAIPLAAAQSNTPPDNTTATDPWWPQYPEGRSINDYMLNDSATDADLRGETDVTLWLIEASNMFRAQFRSGPVTWNETAARIAQNHTNTCLWEHWGNDNLAQQYGSVESMRFDIRSMAEMWAVEWDYYPFSHPELEEYSHFTAMVWNASTTVGCGWNVGCANETDWPSKTYFVCNYWPPGNIITTPPGQLFARNIQNFTGWPVDEVKASSISSLAGLSEPTGNSGSAPAAASSPAVTATSTRGQNAAAGVTGTAGSGNATFDPNSANGAAALGRGGVLLATGVAAAFGICLVLL